MDARVSLNRVQARCNWEMSAYGWVTLIAGSIRKGGAMSPSRVRWSYLGISVAIGLLFAAEASCEQEPLLVKDGQAEGVIVVGRDAASFTAGWQASFNGT